MGHRQRISGLFLPVIVLCLHTTIADYSCLCNYEIELAVLKNPVAESTTIGYMYEFDCKPQFDSEIHNGNYMAIVFEHQVGIYMIYFAEGSIGFI